VLQPTGHEPRSHAGQEVLGCDLPTLKKSTTSRSCCPASDPLAVEAVCKRREPASRSKVPTCQTQPTDMRVSMPCVPSYGSCALLTSPEILSHSSRTFLHASFLLPCIFEPNICMMLIHVVRASNDLPSSSCTLARLCGWMKGGSEPWSRIIVG
jgi:hypothetical protein